MGRERRKSVRQLADEGSVDLDEALVRLWDAGFAEVLTPDDSLGPGDLNRARRALGLPTRRELQSPEYWMRVFNRSPEGLKELIQDIGLGDLSLSSKLPKKVIGRLKAHSVGGGLAPTTIETLEPAEVDVAAEPDFTWETPGHVSEPRFLDEDEVRGIHYALVEDFSGTEDPIDPPGVRSEDLLGSAVYRPHTSLGGQRKYPTLETAAAALLHSLVLDGQVPSCV